MDEEAEGLKEMFDPETEQVGVKFWRQKSSVVCSEDTEIPILKSCNFAVACSSYKMRQKKKKKGEGLFALLAWKFRPLSVLFIWLTVRSSFSLPCCILSHNVTLVKCIVDNNNCAPSFWGHCVKSEVIVLDRGIFLREHSSRRKIPMSKTIADEFTQWPKQMVQSYYCQ